jgi:hypothetical protein
MFSSKKATRKKKTPSRSRELGRKTTRDDDTSSSNFTSHQIQQLTIAGTTTPSKRARLILSTSTSKAKGNTDTTQQPHNLPDSLRSLSADLPNAVLEIITSRKGLTTGCISNSGMWYYTVCDESVYIWRHSILQCHEELRNIGQQTSTTESNHAARLCILESTGHSNSSVRAPNVLYVTDGGTVQCWKSMGHVDQRPFKESLQNMMEEHEQCTSLVSVSQYVAVCTTSTGQVIIIQVDLSKETFTFRVLEKSLPSMNTTSSSSSSSTSSSYSAWNPLNWVGALNSNESKTTHENGKARVLSKHTGTIAIHHQNDEQYEIAYIVPGGPSLPGTIFFNRYTIHGKTGEIVNRMGKKEIHLHGINSPVDPIYAVYAPEVNSFVVSVTYDVPTRYAVVQLSLDEIKSSTLPTSMTQKLIDLDLSSGSIWNVKLLPCGPSTNTKGTFPPDCMLYASCITISNGGNWKCIRTRLKHFSRYSGNESNVFERLVDGNKDQLNGHVFGCGVVDRRPHFLSTIPSASVFTAKQNELLAAYNQNKAVQLRQKSKMMTTGSGNITNTTFNTTNNGNEERKNATIAQRCSESIRNVVDELKALYDVHNPEKNNVTTTMLNKCFGDQTLTIQTVQSSLKWLIVDYLNRGPHLSHAVTLDDRITHKMVGELLHEKHTWMNCCNSLISQCHTVAGVGKKNKEEILMPIVRRYCRKTLAALSLYQHEQDNMSNSHYGSKNTSSSMIERGRQLVVQARYPKVQLLRLGLSVADAYYGNVTQLTDILPYFSSIVRNAAAGISSNSLSSSSFSSTMSSTSASSLEYDSLSVHVEVMKAVQVLLKHLLKRDSSNVYDIELMLTMEHQSYIYEILESSSKMLLSNTNNQQQMSNQKDYERTQRNILLELCANIVEDFICESNLFRRSKDSQADGQFYEKTFKNVVPIILEKGYSDLVCHLGKTYAHYDTLYEYCHYWYVRDYEKGQREMQIFLNDVKLCMPDKFNKEYPNTFSAYVYNRWHREGQSHRILKEPDTRNEDVRKYIEECHSSANLNKLSPSLSWIHALREKKYDLSSNTIIKESSYTNLTTAKTLLSIAKLMELSTLKNVGGHVKETKIVEDTNNTILKINSKLDIINLQKKYIASTYHAIKDKDGINGMKVSNDELLSLENALECHFNRLEQLNNDPMSEWNYEVSSIFLKMTKNSTKKCKNTQLLSFSVSLFLSFT